MLCNDRIKLRIMELEDGETIRNWRFDFDNYDYFYEFTPKSKFANDTWLKSIISCPSEINFVVEDLESKKLIGMGSLIDIDFRSQKCEMGRILIGDKDFRQKGLGFELVSLIQEYAFNHLNVQKIYCEVFCDNKTAIALYEKCGFEKVGVFKRHIFKNGEFKDVLILEKIK